MQKLKRGDLILITAPAGAVKEEHIEKSIQLIEQKGWKYKIAKNTFNNFTFGYNYSGTPEERTEDLQWALDHPEAKAIWFARGGYGGVQIVDSLDLEIFSRKPKWLIGYSDNTIFHQHFNRRGFPTLHATVCKPLPQNQSEETYITLIDALEEGMLKYSFPIHKFNIEGDLKGVVTGGNLSIIYSLIGSRSLDSFKNKILFIEDWYENFYHIDRILLAMERAGVFQELKGLIVGGFTKMDTESSNQNYNEPFDEQAYLVISERFKKYKIPQIFGFPSGHIFDTRAIIMGGEISLKVIGENIEFQNKLI